MYIVYVSDIILFFVFLFKGMINYLINILIKINFFLCVLCRILE